MHNVRQRFTNLGFANVSSYKASGNILFETDMRLDDIVKSIKVELYKLSGRELEVFLRTSSQIKEIVDLNPFKGRNADFRELFVTFIPNKLVENKFNLPATTRNWNTVRGIHEKVIPNYL
jgi:uncharacterized protein (DUF1697 family)